MRQPARTASRASVQSDDEFLGKENDRRSRFGSPGLPFMAALPPNYHSVEDRRKSVIAPPKDSESRKSILQIFQEKVIGMPSAGSSNKGSRMDYGCDR